MRLPPFVAACVAIFSIRVETAVQVMAQMCKGYAEDPVFHRFIGNDSVCKTSDDFLYEWRKTNSTNYCSPKDVQVDLRKADTIYTPSFVTVKRCVGHCEGNEHCHPVTVANKYIEVRGTPTTGKTEECGWVAVEEHTSCACDCKSSDIRCNNHQVPNYNRCKCECKDSMRKYKEGCEYSGHAWDGDLCTCKCPPGNCEDGVSAWAPLICRCLAYEQ